MRFVQECSLLSNAILFGSCPRVSWPNLIITLFSTGRNTFWILMQIAALDESLQGRSALLKHEVAYVLGQMQDAAAFDALE